MVLLTRVKIRNLCCKQRSSPVLPVRRDNRFYPVKHRGERVQPIHGFRTEKERDKNPRFIHERLKKGERGSIFARCLPPIKLRRKQKKARTVFYPCRTKMRFAFNCLVEAQALASCIAENLIHITILLLQKIKVENS